MKISDAGMRTSRVNMSIMDIDVFVEFLYKLSFGADRLKKQHRKMLKYPSNMRVKKSLKNNSLFTFW